MKKMQWARKKNVLLISALFLFSNLSLYSQISGHRLQQADSLFNAKQFVQSLAHYQQVLKKGEFTPAMLLKMAFVEEGLNHVGEALYYLNLYFLATNDETVLEKMDQLSEKYKLTGYDLNETEQAFSFYRKYTDHISFFLIALLLFLFSLAVYVKRRKHSPVPALITLLIIATLFGIHINSGDPELKGIVAGDNTYLMAGPAGAAPVVAVIQGGHRFTIVGRKDVWVQVDWNGTPAFIKGNRVLPVQL